MASWRPELHTKEEVMDYYNQYDVSSYRVFAGTKPDVAYLRFFWDDPENTNKIGGAEKLADALDSIASNPENTNVYLLQIIKEYKERNKGRAGKVKEPVPVSIVFQLNKSGYSQLAGLAPYPMQPATDPNILKALGSIAELNSKILEKLEGVQTIEEEEEEEEEEEPQGNPFMKFINGMLKNPALQQILTQKIAGMVGVDVDTFPKTNMAMAGIENGSGTDQNAKAKQAIDMIATIDDNYGEHMLAIAELSIQDPAQYKMFIGMLKK